MKVYYGFVFVVALTALAPSPSPKPREVSAADREAFARIIQSQVGTGRSTDDQPVAEYAKARRYAQGAGATAGATYVVAQYTIETGNAWQLFLAVLDGKTHQLLAKGRIGGIGYRDATLDAVRDGAIVVETRQYGPMDSLCCPSVAGVSWFEIRDGELWETTALVKGSATHR